MKKRRKLIKKIFLTIMIPFAFLVVGLLGLAIVTTIMDLEPQKEYDTKTMKGDVEYGLDNGMLNLDSNYRIENIEEMSIFMDYNPERIEMDVSGIASEYDFSATFDNENGHTIITLEDVDVLKKDQNIIKMNMGKTSRSDIVVSEVILTFIDGTTESLSVKNK